MISNVYWTASQKFAFQKVDRFFRLYDEEGNFVTEFNSFSAMDEYIRVKEK